MVLSPTWSRISFHAAACSQGHYSFDFTAFHIQMAFVTFLLFIIYFPISLTKIFHLSDSVVVIPYLCLSDFLLTELKSLRILLFLNTKCYAKQNKEYWHGNLFRLIKAIYLNVHTFWINQILYQISSIYECM